MRPERKLIFVHGRKPRFPEHEANIWQCAGHTFRCSNGWAWFYGALCLCFSSLTVFSVVFANLFELCRTNEDCPSTPCQRGVCNAICRLEPIPDCCTHSSDCPTLPCHENVCADNACVSLPLSNIPCDDGSECTSNDQCQLGVCRGAPINRRCHTCTQNVFVQDTDGTSCNDADVCTEHDTCTAGVCGGVPKQCPDKPCNVGVCTAGVGCGFEPTNQVTGSNMCVDAKCQNGVYSETPKNCFDGNPCTLDACYPLTGICVNPPADAGGCNITCTQNSDCHAIGSAAEYACWDGNCADISAGEMIIRLSHAEIDFDGCPTDHARLQLRFFMDSERVNEMFHIPLTESIQGIYPELHAFDVMNEHRGALVRTYFSMRTTCRDLTKDCYPFLNGEYEFLVKRYPCHTLTGAHCIMEPELTHVMLPLSLVNCPTDTQVFITILPTLTVERVLSQVNASVVSEGAPPWITDVTLCVPKALPLAACIANEDIDQCPYRGCTDTPMMYLDERIQFISGGNYTGAMTAYSSQYNVRTAHGYNNYDGDKCASDHDTDWISLSIEPLVDRYSGRTVVFEISYVTPECSARRLNTQLVRIGTFII